jgi:hypothetical protein
MVGASELVDAGTMPARKKRLKPPTKPLPSVKDRL